MSQVYSTEPQTSGLVVFETTHGPLSIHLWCKECPYTVRFFLQLCVDGFYDNLVFHRIVPNFLIQTGDAHYRQDGNGKNDDDNDNDNNNINNNPWKQPPPKKYREQHQAAEALDRRQYELNSRIRFNHRGQIAMALGIGDGDGDDSSKSLTRLQPQFFITLEEASHLDGKHVCFGGITGPTMFNALRIGQTDIFNNDDNDDIRNFQPRIMSEAPRILRTKILQIDLPPTLPALVPTLEPPLLPWRIDPNNTAGRGGTSSNVEGMKKRKKKNRKGVKNINLLSFGEEMNEEEDGDVNVNNKNKVKNIQSSHDVLVGKKSSTTKLKPEVDEKLQRQLSQEEVAGDKDSSMEEKNKSKSKKDTPAAIDQHTNARKDVLKHPIDDDSKMKANPDASHPDSINLDAPTFSSRTNRKAAERMDHIYTTNNTSQPKDDHIPIKNKKDKPKKISLVEARRAKYAKKNTNKKGNKQQREDETMAKFKAFQQKIGTSGAKKKEDGEDDNSNAAPAAAYHGQILEKDFDANTDSDWIKTKFKCRKHMDQDAKNMGGDGRGIDDYEVTEERSSATDRKHGKRKLYRQH